MCGGKAPQVNSLLPIAHPFETEKLHGGTCADEELAVVLDLHKWDTSDVTIILLNTREEIRLWFIVIVEIKERISLFCQRAVHLMFG